MKRNHWLLYASGIVLIWAILFLFHLPFWASFPLLLLVYGAMAFGIISLIALYRGKDVMVYIRNNNTYLYVLACATLITWLISLVHIGPAELLPKNFPTGEQRGAVSNFLNHLWAGKNAPPRHDPSGPPPWATGTWFWANAAWILLLATLIYLPIAFFDELMEVVREIEARVVAKRIEAHEKEVEKIRQHNARRRRGQPEAPMPPAPSGKLKFLEFAKWDLMMELVFKFIGKIFESILNRRHARP